MVGAGRQKDTEHMVGSLKHSMINCIILVPKPTKSSNLVPPNSPCSTTVLLVVSAFGSGALIYCLTMADVSAESHANLQQAATDGDLLLSDLQRWRFRSNVFFGRVLCPSCSNESARYDAQDISICIFVYFVTPFWMILLH